MATQVFTCCFSDQCERHGSVDRPSCPHCHEFKFESGDVLVFNASYDQQIGVCHGVKEILDEVSEGAAEKLPAWMKGRRVSARLRRPPNAIDAILYPRWRGRRDDPHAIDATCPMRTGPVARSQAGARA